MNDLSHLKVGDEVIIRRGRFQLDGVGPITGETPTRFKVGAADYRKKDGRLVGDPYGGRIEEGTPEQIAKVRIAAELHRTRRRLEGFNWGNVSLGQLRQIAAILDGKEQP